MKSLAIVASLWLNVLAAKNATAPVPSGPMPSMSLLSPLGRAVNDDPLQQRLKFCGGTQRLHTHMLANPGSRNIFGWSVHVPSERGNCTVRIGEKPDESAMTVLRPLDGSSNKKGAFACGRSQTEWESKEFRVPEDLNCDTCVVSLEFFTERGPFYMCGDIEILSNADIPECFGTCMNGGICQNGQCVCTYGYSGSSCQYEEVREARGDLLLMLLIYGVMILLILATLFATYLMKKRFDLVQAEKANKKFASSEKDQITSSRIDDIKPVSRSTRYNIE